MSAQELKARLMAIVLMVVAVLYLYARLERAADAVGGPAAARRAPATAVR